MECLLALSVGTFVPGRKIKVLHFHPPLDARGRFLEGFGARFYQRQA